MSKTTEDRFFEVGVTLRLELNDPPDDWISRCFTEEWRSQLYSLKDEDEVYQHLLYNAAVNGVEDISRLEGWADIERGAVRLYVTDWEAL